MFSRGIRAARRRFKLAAFVGCLLASAAGLARADEASQILPGVEFSLFRSIQSGRFPSARGGDGYDEVVSGQAYVEAGIALASQLKTGPVAWDVLAAGYARLVIMQDLWRHASLPHMTYETCPLALQYTERVYHLGLTPRLPLAFGTALSAQLGFDLLRGGSNLWRSRESTVSYPEATLAEAVLLRPELQFTPWGVSSSLYLLLAQYIDNISSEFSYQTFGSGGLSFGARAAFAVPALHMTLQPTLLNYNFVFNDPADDFLRQGMIVQASGEIARAWQWRLALGWLNDRYREPFVSFDDCNSMAGGLSGGPMALCRRSDQEYVFVPEGRYTPFDHWSLTFAWLFQKRVNASLEILQKTDSQMILGVEYAPGRTPGGAVPQSEIWRDDPAARLYPARE